MTNRTFIFAAALAAVSAAPAIAGERTERVSYRDLDLASAAGQTELQRRLDAATWRVCRFEDDGSLASAADESACFRETRKTVAAQVAHLASEVQRGG